MAKFVHGLAALTAGLAFAAAARSDVTVAGSKGPSTASTPYLVPAASGVRTVSVLTVGESVSPKLDGVTPYRMVGLPDGLGAYDNGDGTFTLLMNHELGATSGVVRAHGARGAFVSAWPIGSQPSRRASSTISGWWSHTSLLRAALARIPYRSSTFMIRHTPTRLP